VKLRVIQRFAGVLLTASLLFNQAGIGYLHDVHDAHKEVLTDRTKEVVLPHGDHCRICSIDLLFNLYFSSPQEYAVTPVQSSENVASEPSAPSGIVSLTRNKAPPMKASRVSFLNFC
jgi:hypothetical protein